jgi:hypothetical protein
MSVISVIEVVHNTLSSSSNSLVHVFALNLLIIKDCGMYDSLDVYRTATRSFQLCKQIW